MVITGLTRAEQDIMVDEFAEDYGIEAVDDRTPIVNADDRPKLVTLMFQGPDFNDERNPKSDGYTDSGFSLTVIGFDLDYNRLTVYPQADGEMDYNAQLAIKSPYMNEDGHECGEIAWRIDPEESLLHKHPELGQHVGKIYGRVIVSA